MYKIDYVGLPSVQSYASVSVGPARVNVAHVVLAFPCRPLPAVTASVARTQMVVYRA